MIIKNLTPHEIKILVGEKEIVLAASSSPARVEMTREKVGEVELNGVKIPVNQAKLGKVVNLPEPTDNVIYIVSRQVAEACPQRQDLLIVDETVRDEKSRIIGAKSLARV